MTVNPTTMAGAAHPGVGFPGVNAEQARWAAAAAGVDPVWAVANAGSTATVGGDGAVLGGGAERLGSDAFLRLLAAQLQYQDPLRPMEDTAFVAQLAQFTQLEETRAMHGVLVGYAALSLLGREVVVTTADGEHRGLVTQVTLDPRSPALVIGGATVPWAEIVGLSLATASTGGTVPGAVA